MVVYQTVKDPNGYMFVTNSIQIVKAAFVKLLICKQIFLGKFICKMDLVFQNIS